MPARVHAAAVQPMLPIVSVIMPVYDMPLALVERALQSAVTQDYPGLIEIVIWNDGSRDRGYEGRLDAMARSAERSDRPIEVRHSRQNRGISAARNDACKIAIGDWLIWLDGDDELPPRAIADLVAAARRWSLAWLVLGQCRTVLPGGAEQHRNDVFVARWRSTKGLPEDPLFSVIFAVHGALVHRRAFWSVGGFDLTMEHGELTDWFLRVMAVLPSAAVVVTDQETYRYHKRIDSHSARRDAMETSRVKALSRYAAIVGVLPCPSRFRFGRRCSDTGARLYSPFSTIENRVVEFKAELDTVRLPAVG